MKDRFKKLPLIGPLSVRLIRQLRGQKERTYVFRRVDPTSAPKNGMDRDTQQIINLLNYTKTSGSEYNGQAFPAGYHTLDLKKLHLAGQRQPKQRLKSIPFDFAGKTVLDIGCNQGGMLFGIADTIAHGIGIDYDYRVINVSNRIRAYTATHNLDFYVFDLENENHDLVKDFISGDKVDIVFLLAVCMWIRNWKRVIDLAQELSDHLLFESNGTSELQDEQVAYLQSRYNTVELLSDNSEDDDGRKSRRLYFCH